MNTSLGAIPGMLYCNSGSGRGGFADGPVKADADMKWFRSNIRLGSRLALFALAIQFLLSFGHFHGGSAQAASPGAKLAKLHDSVASVSVRLDARGQAAQANAAGHVRKTSSGHLPAGHGSDDCAICAVMALASAMVGAVPPSLPARQATTFTYAAAATGLADPVSARRAFQPRAPPIV